MSNRNLIAFNGVYVKTPTQMEVDNNDISDPDAGRTLDCLMHKMKKGEKRKIMLSWTNITPEEANEVLRATSAEYFSCRYFDPHDNGYVTRTFYRGDTKAVMKIWTVKQKRYGTVSFDVIER